MTGCAVRPQSGRLQFLIMPARRERSDSFGMAGATGLRQLIRMNFALGIGNRQHNLLMRLRLVLHRRVAAVALLTADEMVAMHGHMPFKIAIAQRQRRFNLGMARDAGILWQDILALLLGRSRQPAGHERHP